MDLGRPALEEVAQVRAHALRLLFARLRVSGPREEGVPLVPAAADVGDDEVLPRANVHLVPALGVAVGVVELAREDGVACAGKITRSVECAGVSVGVVAPKNQPRPFNVLASPE